MSLSCYFVKLSATVLAQYSVIHLLHHLLLCKLLAATDDVHLRVAASLLPASTLLWNIRGPLLSEIYWLTSRLKHCSKLIRLGFPFGNWLVLHFFYFPLSCLALTHRCNLLSIDNPLLCGIEDFSLFTKYFFANSFVALKSLPVEGPSTIITFWELVIRFVHLLCFEWVLLFEIPGRVSIWA